MKTKSFYTTTQPLGRFKQPHNLKIQPQIESNNSITDQSRITSVKETSNWTQTATRIENKALRGNRLLRNINFYCNFCEVVTRPNTWRYREFISEQQLGQQEGRKLNCKEFRNRNVLDNNYYCQGRKDPFTAQRSQP